MSQDIYEKLKNSVVEMDPDLAKEAANEAIEAGLDPLECISLGLSKGMAVMGDLFDVGEAFVPDLMMASEAFETAVNILTSSMSTEEKNNASSGKVIIHTVQGDIHDIGKNIVSTMFAANNFEVFDLGRDVPVNLVIEKAEEYGVDLICGSALMTTTMASMKEIVNTLKEDGIRDKYIVMFGGAPVSAKWCNEIGADGYTDTASEVAAMAKDLIAKKRGA
ncbi:cobalamin B12-binding domain-containing protein [Desulfosporosinus lacus]|uniref:Trimethylamine corrinoid protein n=1 Tax=Desulfosporosinus lacus DSM 15449 TaxID=1121420 RepID=A0A1M6GMZ2_9FIRM|nr:corrinoid protein [Desulfosporosinus lacus]SHJ11270.1 trimethylamine corrinoid protein [Desulfosporosinus lacus DSM 15449]